MYTSAKNQHCFLLFYQASSYSIPPFLFIEYLYVYHKINTKCFYLCLYHTELSVTISLAESVPFLQKMTIKTKNPPELNLSSIQEDFSLPTLYRHTLCCVVLCHFLLFPASASQMPLSHTEVPTLSPSFAICAS